MARLSYYLKRIKNMSFKGMFDRIKLVSKKCKKSKIAIFFDMIWCGFRYGAGYMDYDVIGFYKLNHEQRDSMLTRGRNDKIVKSLNNKNYWHLFNNKNEFNSFFSEFIPRDWAYINPNNIKMDKEFYKNEEFIKFKSFIAKHPIFFAKPNDGQCGKGIQKIDAIAVDSFLEKQGIKVDPGYKIPTDEKINYTVEVLKNEANTYYNARIRTLFKFLIDNKLYLLEEPIRQHAIMNLLNPSSVNTCRIVSVMNSKKEVTLMASFIRIGNGSAVVDNFNSGGMTAKVDIETGKIIEDAVNKEGKMFSKHPLSGTPINGFEIPYFKEAKEMVIKAAKKSKNVRYVGWDVAITEKGPTLVEGNQYPGHDIYQVAEKLDENSMGVWPQFKKAIE
ncbi:MAG: hypothetical protein IKI57_07515 [Clostridia bacterium]|nr:hypothetical protein [Clostridia bacterium]